MEAVERLFHDLESNNLEKVDQSKRKFSDFFNSTKDSWLINGMLDYFCHTSSSRIVDILVKVHPPHDKYIFDKLADWIGTAGPNRNQAITLFGNIVKRHPSWLYKVANHQLFKEILKLLKSESNIISIMNALFCLITLLPIIPTSMSDNLPDLFEIFVYLASWISKTETSRLTDEQLIHLEQGLNHFFVLLYGMFPCNFTAYLRDNLRTEKALKNGFVNTINQLLEKVIMHPNLLTANSQTEKSSGRWKEMEPHDVVFECSKITLNYVGRVPDPHTATYFSPNPSASSFRSVHQTPHSDFGGAAGESIYHQIQNPKKVGSPFYSLFNEPPPKSRDPQKLDYFWSPSIAVLATPPPTGTVPHTPTPTPNIPSYGIPTIPGSQLCASGASPPEAAIEATPETTPLKDNIKTLRPFPVNSTAVRAIWGSSQPSSPMKKEPSPFRFPDAIISSPKLLNLVNERNAYQMQLINDRQQHTIGKEEVPHNPLSDSEIEIQETDVENPLNVITQEDAEVTEINSKKMLKAQLNDFDGFALCSSAAVDTLRRRDCDNHKQSDGSSSNDKYTSPYGQEISKSWPTTDINTKLLPPPSKTLAEQKHQNGNSSSSSDDDEDDDVEEVAKKLENFKSKISRSKRNDFGLKLLNANKISISTQTIDQVPKRYQEIYFDDKPPRLLADQNLGQSQQQQPALKSPHTLLDQYIETSIKKRNSNENNNVTETYRDQIKLLTIQLQFERYRREVHAERNRRLLGKSRANTALETDNQYLKTQKDELALEVVNLTANLNKARIEKTRQDQDYVRESQKLLHDLQRERDENKQLRLSLDAANRQWNDEKKSKKDTLVELEGARAEIFDLRNDLQQTQYQADLGLQYKEELNRLQSEVVLMGEIQIKCRDKITELNNLKARDVEIDSLQYSYEEEVREMRYALDVKSAQLDTAKARLVELESQLGRRDSMFTEQKRLLKTVKEEYEDKFKALEAKYTAQKAIILRLEEEILELYKNQSAVNLASLSPDSEKTDMVGSLDHTSPLSISLASSEGLSMSLRSVTEIRNLHPLVVQSDNATASSRQASSTDGGGSGSGVVRRQIVSEDIPVPGPSQHHHLHQYHNK